MCLSLLHNSESSGYHPGMHLNPWHILVIAIAGWMNREQAGVVEYLKEENRVLRESLGTKRPRLNDDQRRRLAAKGKALGHTLLSTFCCIVFRRHRDAGLGSATIDRALLRSGDDTVFH